MKILPIAKIKAFPPGHVISGVRGKVLMVKAPVDPNEHDLKRARHRQSVQIMDAAGDKLWVQLTRSKHHIFPDQKGRILVLESISTDKGNAGLVANPWEDKDGNAQFTLEVGGEAAAWFQEEDDGTGGEAEQEQPAEQEQEQKQRRTPAEEEFHAISKHLELCWDEFSWIESEVVRQKMTVTLFIETTKLIGKVGNSKKSEKISSPKPANCEAPTQNAPEPEEKPTPAKIANSKEGPGAAHSANIKEHNAWIEREGLREFGMSIIMQARDQLKEQAGLDDRQLFQTIIEDLPSFKQLCQSIYDDDDIPF